MIPYVNNKVLSKVCNGLSLVNLNGFSVSDILSYGFDENNKLLNLGNR